MSHLIPFTATVTAVAAAILQAGPEAGPAAAPPPLALSHLFITLAILAAAIVLGFIVQRVVASTMHAMAKRTANEWDDIIVESMRGLVVLWFALIGLAVILRLVPLRAEVALIVRRSAAVLGILSTAVFFTRAARRSIHVYIDRKVQVPTSIFKNFASFIIYLLAFLVVLDHLGISITPLLTAMGVSGLAVALAFQDTMANLFAGMNILMARKIQVGDYIRLDSGEEGRVVDISWRNTTLRNPDDNMVIVPNSKLAAAIYTNTHLPASEMGLYLPVTVAFDSDLALVERVTIEVAAEVLAVPEWHVPGFEPYIRYNAYTDLGVRFSVGLRIGEYEQQYRVRHAFYKRLHERFRAEGIKLAVPPRLVTIDK
ncbi:MAG TPA: mechanosensitive ion channel family protein [Candidatus Aminicenantes bacterium]|nr:mechanosensitive ion channel family protein [Candidatus Aminicenantes bacterium]HRY65714.1 mechanosensitive ion channel family protein [Candidatus Aminicenantes bacterium]HRZ72628.1 mechanosensitive ion channel family protein [Candidatus Aminicenantes bacterium]